MNEVIKYNPVSLWAQKITQCEVSEIHLYETHIRMIWKFYADEPIDKQDLDLGWDSNVFNYFDITAKKDAIVSIELGYSSKNKAWYTTLSINGMSADVNFYVKKQSEAQEIYNKLYNYLFS